MLTHEKDWYAELEKKYDPTGIYKKKFEKDLNKDEKKEEKKDEKKE